MRTLTFSDDEQSKKRFEVLFHGMYVLGNQNTQKGLSVLRTEIAILDKLESISKPCDCGKTLPGSKESDRELMFLDDVPSTVVINDQEFDLLYDYVSKVPWSIGAASRAALSTLDWLKNPNGSKTS